jgi:hypothetical protein
VSIPANSVETTGGAGFNFEDGVAAFFLAAMLGGIHPYGTDLGTIEGLAWQTRGDGWRLDDLAVRFNGPSRGTLALSVKSDRQVTAAGFPRQFTEAAWEQYSDTNSSNPFVLHRDLFGLVVGALAGTVLEAWQTLFRALRFGDTSRIAARYSSQGESSEIGRTLLRSFVSAKHPELTEAVSIVRNVRLYHFDFKAGGSQSAAFAIWVCQVALRSGDPSEARALWRRLVGVAAEHRESGGSIDIPALVAIVRVEFELKDRIDHAAEWHRLDRRSSERAEDVIDSIAERLSLVRHDIINDLRAILSEGQCILLAGEGGSGKSALAKRLATGSHLFQRCLWLDATSLDHDSMDEVDRHLGISTPLTDMLAECTHSSSCLILDGLETFTPRSIARVAVILKGLAPNPAARGWTIVATTRPQGIIQARLAFQRADIAADGLSVRYIDGPTEAECSAVLATSRRLNAWLVRRELRAGIRNFKLLDWILRDADTVSEVEVAGWVGVSHVVDSLWQRWVGTDAASAARSGVMKTLARLEGEGLQHGIGLSRLQVGELAALADLESRELLRLKDERIWFRHDMLADWARLRILVEEAVAGPSALTESARFPRWHDSIRLYGQRLLDTDSAAPASWIRAVAGLTGEEPATVVARDMLLEGLFCSANARTLIDKVWGALCRETGVLLRRMLKRFLYAATIPDPRMRQVIERPDHEAELAPHWRYPWWPLWPGVLAVLSKHTDDVVTLAPLEAAEVCNLWLRSMPMRAPGRMETAQLAVAIGREVQGARGEGLYFHDHHEDKVIFESVLYASHELPNDVSALCLELSRRRPDPPEVVERARAHNERTEREMAERLAKNPPKEVPHSDFSNFFDHGPLREQFPDGPSARVDEGLQRAVLDGQGIVALASVIPEVGREVVLACSLEPPRPVRYDELSGAFDHMGVEDHPGAYQAMYFSGPWLPLLRLNPELGIDCIVRLVNQATRNWEAASVPADASPEERAATRVAISTDVGAIEYVGDVRVYGWYRERLCSSTLLVSALMALEKWLYDRLEQDEAVDEPVRQILSTSRSVAILGVLVGVGMSRPALFRGPLAQLLSIWRLYEWDFHLIDDGDIWQIGFFQWASSGERIFEMVREWHTMPHRKRPFRDGVVSLLLTSQEIREQLATIRTQWAEELASGRCIAPDSLELLIARFDLANYHFVHRDNDTIEVSFDWPEALRTRVEHGLKQSSQGMSLLTFPIQCRELLDAGKPMSDEEAESFWTQLRKVVTIEPGVLGDDFPADRKHASILGGIAVLMNLASVWLSADREREDWCASRMSETLQSPPPRGPLDTEHSISTDCWHSFQAEIAVALLAESPESPDVRAFAAGALTSYWYATTGVGLRLAYRYRDKLGNEFNRLVNLSVLWAALRSIKVPHDSNPGDQARMLARRDRLIGTFTRFRVPSSMMDWNAIERVAERGRNRLLRKHYPEYREESRRRRSLSGQRASVSTKHPGFDIEALRHSFSWLPLPSVALSSIERDQNVGWLSELLNVSLRMLPDIERDDSAEVSGTPYKFDRWVFDTVAKFVVQMAGTEDPARLWQPILELGPAAHYWVESFLGAWTVSALGVSPSPSEFFARWKEMIEFATHSPVWMPDRTRQHLRLRRLWERLLGMHLGAGVTGADGHQQYFADMVPLYRIWAERYLNDDRSLDAYSYFLTQDGARLLLCPSIPWLLRAAESIRPYEWSRNHLADTVAGALRAAWTWHSDSIAANGDLLVKFSALLNLLVTHQSPVAMDLRDKVSRSVPLS